MKYDCTLFSASGTQSAHVLPRVSIKETFVTHRADSRPHAFRVSDCFPCRMITFPFIYFFADHQAGSPESGGFLRLKFERGFNHSPNNGAIEIRWGFRAGLNSLWINKPLLHKQLARPTPIIIQPQTMGSPAEFHGVRTTLAFVLRWV